MGRFDRYLLSQFLVLFGFFALVLVSVYWINKAVVLFDRLIADGHSTLIFAEFTALSLPSVIGQVLPIAAFAGAVYVTNRLSNDSELTVMQATGFSPWRLARPVLAYGLIAAAMMAALTLYLIPASLAQLDLREREITSDSSARLLREGTFLHPSKGVTFYIRRISDDGELRDVFLSDRRDPNETRTFTAKRAYLVRSDATMRLVMVDGLAQRLDTETRRLSTTTFSDFSYDLARLMENQGRVKRDLDEISTRELFSAPEAIAAETRRGLGKVLQEAHGRLHRPALTLVAALIGFSTLMAARFSRFGIGRQILLAIALVVLVMLSESLVSDPVKRDAALWPLVYLPAVLGLAISGAMLWRSSHTFVRLWPRRRARAEGTA